jgi:hypothetical protein
MASGTENLAGLHREFWSSYAQLVLTGTDFGVTVHKVFFGVCRDGARELAIDVEVGGFGGIVEEPNLSFRSILCRRENAE